MALVTNIRTKCELTHFYWRNAEEREIVNIKYQESFSPDPEHVTIVTICCSVIILWEPCNEDVTCHVKTHTFLYSDVKHLQF